jgi:hypothetical protein
MEIERALGTTQHKVIVAYVFIMSTYICTDNQDISMINNNVINICSVNGISNVGNTVKTLIMRIYI